MIKCLCQRIGNLNYIKRTFEGLYKRYIPNGQHKEELLSSVLDATFEKMIKYVCNRFIYIENGSVLFSELYDPAKAKENMQKRIETMTKRISEIKAILPSSYFPLILDNIEQVFAECMHLT
jgi:hypothetical protein